MEKEDGQENAQLTEASTNQGDGCEKYEEVLQEIERQESGKSSWIKKLLILAFTIFIFFRLGLSTYGLNSVLIIIGVLLIHELGHFVGMRLFGYRNVKMFFIPLIGAAVSGQSRNVGPSKKTVVTLLGPVPGILLGIVLGGVYLRTRTPILLELALMLVFINGFNLLPFMPLDGGRFLRDILFARNSYVEFCFGLLGAAGLLAGAYFLKAWLLGVIGVISFFGSFNSFKLSRLAKEMRAWPDDGRTDETTEPSSSTAYSEHIPPETGRRIIKRIYERMGGNLRPKVVARMSRDVWERMHARPVGIGATVGFLAGYLVMVGVAAASFVVIPIAMASAPAEQTENKIVVCAKTDGTKEWKYQTYAGDRLVLEVGLSPWAVCFHGREVAYHHNGQIGREGNWDSGHRDGTWKEYNARGKLDRVMVFEKGKFISCKELVGSRWVEKSFEELPKEDKEYCLWEIGRLYVGPEPGTKWENETPK